MNNKFEYRYIVTVREAEENNLIYNDSFDVNPLPFGFMNKKWEELKLKIQEGDKLIEYRTSEKSWEHMSGREGIWLVRDSKLIDQIITEMN